MGPLVRHALCFERDSGSDIAFMQFLLVHCFSERDA